MAGPTDIFDLGRLNLTSGDGRRIDTKVHVDGLDLGGQRYEARGAPVPVRLDVSRTTTGDDLRSPYLDGDELDLRSWARDALALALPAQIVCTDECRGLCAICGENLNEADPGHAHERAPDPSFAKLGEI